MPRYRLVNKDPQSGKDTRALEAHRDSLYARLELSYARIEQGLAQGEEVRPWEDFWIALLEEYEGVCRELQRDLAV